MASGDARHDQPCGASLRAGVFALGIRILWFTPAMQPRLAALLMLVVSTWMTTPTAWAGGKAEVKASLTFHMETESSDNPKMIFAQVVSGKAHYFRRMPEITTKDVQSFNPFPSGDSDGYGIAFKLNETAAKRYAAVTNVNQGHWMVAQMNGRVVDAVFIDQTINDGVVVVWQGATLADIKVFDDALPRIGQEGKKKK